MYGADGKAEAQDSEASNDALIALSMADLQVLLKRSSPQAAQMRPV